ncbi:hypothetical protein TNCV_4825991 [Trichonephila clavipes]|uniref:Uncharacterized protein n=1 Tax=Trichonephila clavipes TaxID=2585209 RepID=A0A8X6RN18_TRICX|nr:hypothetical protein TNCV_4825991 [Trichonephila clavipes]
MSRRLEKSILIGFPAQSGVLSQCFQALFSGMVAVTNNLQGTQCFSMDSTLDRSCVELHALLACFPGKPCLVATIAVINKNVD